jgi:hypothetical protein
MKDNAEFILNRWQETSYNNLSGFYSAEALILPTGRQALITSLLIACEWVP